jgi:hypothetical protein
VTALATVRAVRPVQSTALAAVAAGLVAAFVVAPAPLAATASSGGISGERHLTAAVREAFVEYWRSGDRDFPSSLAGVVDYWFRYHVVKATIAALLLTVLVVLGVLLWKAFLGARGTGARRRTALASAGTLVTGLALISLTAVMANIQGAVAPFASLLPMLTGGPADGELAGTLEQVRQRMAGSPNPGDSTPAVQVMTSDFLRYHVVMAVIAAVVAAGFAVLSVICWKWSASTGASDRGRRRLLRSFGVFSVLSALLLAVIAVANTTTAADPAPALAAFFNGGW